MNETTSNLDLKQLRIQAKELLAAARGGNPIAIQRVLPYFNASTELKLAHAQLVLAREHGHASWAALRQALGESRQSDPLDELFAAIEALDVERVQAMVTRSPNLAGCWRKTDYGGWESTLHVAAKRGSLELAKALVEAGAEVYAVRQSDYPPVFEAHYSGNKELVAFLLAASAETDSGQPPTYGCGIDIVCASRLGMLDRVQMHLERDPFAVYRRGCIGETVLHWPSHNGYVEVVEALLSAGAVIEADEIGLYGGKPLHWASEHEPTTVRVLLAAGAKVNSRNLLKGDFEGFTPLHMCASQRNESTEVADLLLAAGADPSLLDAKGRNPLQVARDYGRSNMALHLGSHR